MKVGGTTPNWLWGTELMDDAPWAKYKDPHRANKGLKLILHTSPPTLSPN
jgi:hypothetical protein